MKFIVVPDSFKGGLSARDAAAAISRGIVSIFPDATPLQLPMADGGEGTVEALASAKKTGEHGEFPRRVTATVTGPLGEPVTATYAFIDERTAVLEMASAAGLPLMGGGLDVGGASTFGVGELLRHAVERGARRVLIGAGGSATHDVGCGAAAALGVQFLDASESNFVPTGATLERVARVDCSGVGAPMRDVGITVLADIDNPLVGPRGAAAVFAPQKGADAEMVERLEAGSAHVAEVFARDAGVVSTTRANGTASTAEGRSIANMPGAGAAGGFAGGLAALFGARIRPGIDALLDAVGFDELLDELAGGEACPGTAAGSGTVAGSGTAASAGSAPEPIVVFTAEGQIDGQSLSGKVPVGVARRVRDWAARRVSDPASGVAASPLPQAPITVEPPISVIVLAGAVGDELDAVYAEGVTSVFPIGQRPESLEDAMASTAKNLESTAANVARLLSQNS